MHSYARDCPEKGEALTDQIRVDRSRLPSVIATDEGYLRGDAVVTRCGVFEYLNADGTIRRELRHPDDVLAADSLATLRMLPITLEHPAGVLVNSDNVSTLSVGSTGENYTVDGDHVQSTVTIMASRAVSAARAGTHAELSMGYKLRLDEEAGVWNGQPYTHRQRDIRYNHLAMVPVGRAGRAARLNLDGAAVQLDTQENPMLKINIDGLAYDAAPEVVNLVTKLRADAETAAAKHADAAATAQASLDKLQANYDALFEAKKKSDEELEDEKKKNTDEAIGARIAERTALLDRAGKIAKFDAAGLNAIGIMTAALKAQNPAIALDGKSDDYITARFDTAVEAFDAQAGATRADAVAGTAKGGGDGKAFDEAKARADAAEAISNQWKGGK